MKASNLIKKVMFLAIISLVSVAVNAQQKGDMGAGLNLAFGTKSGFTNFGVGAKFQYNILDQLRIEPSATFFLKKDYTNMWDINANVHYLFSLNEKFRLYPLAGLGIVGIKTDFGDWGWGYGPTSASTTKFGVNIGAGGEYLITDNIALNLELKYQIVANWSRLIFSLGGAYKF